MHLPHPVHTLNIFQSTLQPDPNINSIKIPDDCTQKSVGVWIGWRCAKTEKCSCITADCYSFGWYSAQLVGKDNVLQNVQLILDSWTKQVMNHNWIPPTTTITVLGPFVRNYPREPVPEETYTHSHLSWSSTILYQLPPSTTIHSILPVQWTSLKVVLHNLSLSPLWSTSWSGTLHFILHTFLHRITVFFSQHISMPSQPVLL